ncbi:MAG TPA: hypothetical protein VKP78_07280 [bacterium]|nr:hypothetical protein [bacterium]
MTQNDGWYYVILDKGKRGAPLSSTLIKRNKRYQYDLNESTAPCFEIFPNYVD